MHVFLDTNILIADPWLTSRRLESAKEYLLKTRGSLVLLDSVQEEFRGHMFRILHSRTAAVETALHEAARAHIPNLPVVDSTTVAAQAFSQWEAKLESFFRGPSVIRVKTEADILGEVIRRAAHRIAPVKTDGKEVRDTIVWLSMLAFLRLRQTPGAAVFISANTNDFAGPDRIMLRRELAEDVATIKGTFEYFSSLEAFIRTYAAPVEHISKSWVGERLDLEIVREKIKARLDRADAARLFRISDRGTSNYYAPRHVIDIDSMIISLDDVYVYEVEDGSIDVFLDFTLEGTVEVESELVRSPPRDEDDYYMNDFPAMRTYTVDAELMCSMDAVIDGERVLVGDIEELTRY